MTCQRITEAELTALIIECTPEKIVSTTFGPGWADINATPANQWALQRIAEMRAEVIESQAIADKQYGADKYYDELAHEAPQPTHCTRRPRRTASD